MNRHSLKWQIIFLFTLLFLGANSFTFVLVRGITRHRYDSYIQSNDLRQAENLANLIAETWEEGREWMDRVQADRQMMVPGRMMMGMDRSRRREPPPESRSVFVLNPRGDIIYSTYRGERAVELDIDRGVPFKVDGKVRGYVLIGSMADQSLAVEDRAFLSGLNRIYILSSVGFTLVGLLMALFLINRLFSPLEKIHQATERLSLGDYQSRSGLTGRDEISQLGQSFDAMARAVEQSRQWKEQLIADTAHELRTPAALIQGTLEMIRDGIYKPTPEKLEELHREAESLSRLIAEMQQLSSLEGKRPELDREIIELEPWLRGICSSFQSLAREKSVVLEWDPPIVDLSLSADPGKLRQVLQNLLKNGLTYSPEGSSMFLSVQKKADHLRFEIDDQGPGIPEADRERVFERFTRLDSSRNRDQGGRGLGLAITKAIVEAHGGSVGAEEAAGGGARLWFTIPLL